MSKKYMKLRPLPVWIIACIALAGGLLVFAPNGPVAQWVHSKRSLEDRVSDDFVEEIPLTISELVEIDALAEGPFRTAVFALELAGKRRVAAALRESPCLHNDIRSLQVDADGEIFYVCARPQEFLEGDEDASEASPMASALGVTEYFGADVDVSGSIALSDLNPLHSRPGATRVLFLDFDGATLSGSAWNQNYGVSEYDFAPYSYDDDTTTFSEREQTLIYETWQRVAEDYSPFDVDVTLEQPSEMTPTTAWALITPGTDLNGVSAPHDGYGGLAYVGKFGYSSFQYYSPALVLAVNTSYVLGEAVSHELGHNLGLHHDGDDSSEYYSGHDGSSMSWAPIMGNSYYKNVTQWSKGDYEHANNQEDDVALLSARLPVIVDAHGDSFEQAAPIALSNDLFSVSGRIATQGDVDYFNFDVPSRSSVEIHARTLRMDSRTRGANVDVELALVDSTGQTICFNDYEFETSAVIEVELPAGSYGIRVRAVGVGRTDTELACGYTDYGSLGQYELTGSIASVFPRSTGGSLPASSGFESTGAIWSASAFNDVHWAVGSYMYSPSGTGPAWAPAGTGFAYSNIGYSDRVYRLCGMESSFDLTDWESATLSFRYFMYGVDMGPFSVDVYDGIWHEDVWSLKGEQQTSKYGTWPSTTVDLTPYVGHSGVVIRFRTHSGISQNSRVAVDAVVLTPGTENLDFDNDGIPNRWEMNYFGSALAADDSALSANGVDSLLDAYIAGFDPTDALSSFEISIAPDGTISWPSLEGRLYQVYGAPSFSEPFLPVSERFYGSAWTPARIETQYLYQVEVGLE